MKQFDWKKLLPYAVAIVAFVAIAMIYCAPLFEGKVLVQGDVNNWKGAAQEALSFYDEHGYSPWWTNSMFSGMPTYQITGNYAIFRKQYWLGAPLVMLYGIMSINLHPQMTYYIFMRSGYSCRSSPTRDGVSTICITIR